MYAIAQHVATCCNELQHRCSTVHRRATRCKRGFPVRPGSAIHCVCVACRAATRRAALHRVCCTATRRTALHRVATCYTALQPAAPRCNGVHHTVNSATHARLLRLRCACSAGCAVHAARRHALQYCTLHRQVSVACWQRQAAHGTVQGARCILHRTRTRDTRSRPTTARTFRWKSTARRSRACRLAAMASTRMRAATRTAAKPGKPWRTASACSRTLTRTHAPASGPQGSGMGTPCTTTPTGTSATGCTTAAAQCTTHTCASTARATTTASAAPPTTRCCSRS